MVGIVAKVKVATAWMITEKKFKEGGWVAFMKVLRSARSHNFIWKDFDRDVVMWNLIISWWYLN